MRIPFLVAATAGLAASPLLAHDFWLQPAAFWANAAQRVPIVMLVGHGPARERSAIPRSRITQFRATGPGGTVDRLRDLSPGGAADASLTFAAPGAYVVHLATGNATSDLPAKRFNDYAREEGLTAVLNRRAATGTMNRPGKEFYSRRAKTIIQIGRPGSVPQPHVVRPVGLGLEIVPLVNPYASGNDRNLTVRVLYAGDPLPGALVKLTDLGADSEPVEMHRSDASGLATFRARKTGQWQFNVVWSEPLARNSRADYLTMFSSLTFGFPAGRSNR